MATWNSDGTPANIQSIHDNTASNGDTITIPAGSFTWTSGVTITKAIKLQGAGAGRIIGYSNSNVLFGTGTKTFTVQSGFSVTNGTTLRIWRTTTDTGYSAYMLRHGYELVRNNAHNEHCYQHGIGNDWPLVHSH